MKKMRCEESASDLAVINRERARGFAALLREASEHSASFDHEDFRGVARIARDIAERTNEVYEVLRAEMLNPAVKDTIFAALAEHERLEAVHIAAIKKTDAAQMSGDECALADAEREQEAARRSASECEEHVLSMRPQTVPGALALLRFIAETGKDLSGRNRQSSCVIFACADLIEREARA